MIGSKFEILIADDNPADVVLVRETLKQHQVDCSLLAIGDGEQVLAFLKQLDRGSRSAGLDLLLLDMHLPKHDGGEILEWLRSADRIADTPVVVMTSSSSPQDREAAIRHGALHYFQKPATLGEFMRLGAIVREILEKNKPNRSATSAEQKRAQSDSGH